MHNLTGVRYRTLKETPQKTVLEQVSKKDVNNNLIIYTSRPTLDFSYVYLYGCPMNDVKKTE